MLLDIYGSNNNIELIITKNAIYIYNSFRSEINDLTKNQILYKIIYLWFSFVCDLYDVISDHFELISSI